MWKVRNGKTFISQYYFNHFFFRGSLSEKPYLLFHDPTKCLSLNSVFGCPTPQVCVEECPKQTTSLFAYATFLSSGGIIPSDFGNFSFDYQRQFCTGDSLLYARKSSTEKRTIKTLKSKEAYMKDLI